MLIDDWAYYNRDHFATAANPAPTTPELDRLRSIEGRVDGEIMRSPRLVFGKNQTRYLDRKAGLTYDTAQNTARIRGPDPVPSATTPAPVAPAPVAPSNASFVKEEDHESESDDETQDLDIDSLKAMYRELDADMGTVEAQASTLAKQQATIAKQQAAIAKQQAAIAKQQGFFTGMLVEMARKQNRLKRGIRSLEKKRK
ncbi:hypothetical protein PG994_001803 [Apiospora phragmitis]|uniref:Uncharacterized protein n=1 Tax=Apiospora phragmitis TaxID=2905665 RepID=A0ABR1WUG8_9PEZI